MIVAIQTFFDLFSSTYITNIVLNLCRISLMGILFISISEQTRPEKGDMQC